jgi:hypothetical protein
MVRIIGEPREKWRGPDVTPKVRSWVTAYGVIHSTPEQLDEGLLSLLSAAVLVLWREGLVQLRKLLPGFRT